MTYIGAFDGEVVVLGIPARGRDGYWAVLQVVDANGEVLIAVGATLARFAEHGRRVGIRGRWQDHPKYGRQVVVDKAVPVLEIQTELPDPVDVLKTVPHVGAKRARLLVDYFGAGAVINQIDLDPRSAFAKVAGLPYSQALDAARWWRRQRVRLLNPRAG